MTPADIARQRAAVQGLSVPRADSPQKLVAWLGALQAQEYALSKWSVAQRIAGGRLRLVEAALRRGTILRTHVLRPTWHLVPRDDLRWMQRLTAPRVRALLACNDRRNGISAEMIASSTRAAAAAIARRGHLTRAELTEVLAATGIRVNPWLVSQLLIHAELDAVLCSGVPRERQQTYALVEERAPRPRVLDGDDALAELALRYFRSRGPATAKDFRWWSGLDAASVSRAVDALGRRVESWRMGDRVYLSVSQPAPEPPRLSAAVVQPYDEIAVAYSESRDVIDPRGAARRKGWGLLVRAVMLDGMLAARWRMEGTARSSEVRLEPLRRLTAAERAAVDRAVAAFAAATSPDADRTDPGPSRWRSTRRRSH